RFHNAGKRAPVFQRHDRRLESGRNGFVREENRFEDVLACLPLPDGSQLRADFAAFTVDFVAAQASYLLPLEESSPALFGVAAVKAFAPLRERIVRVPRGFILREPLRRSSQ